MARLFFSALFPLIATTAVAATTDTDAVCSALAEKYPNNLIWDPLGGNGVPTVAKTAQYDNTTTDYWNVGSAVNRAACIFYPANAKQVSFAVKQLNQHKSAPFALKSGGHMSNLGFSSTDDGVLISFRPNLASTTVSPDRTTAVVGPGSKWDEAVSTVNEYGRTVVGGRLGHVGVAGYILGGGLSFLSAQYGFAADTVTNFEVVLADGTITNANAKSNPDLYWALKGGGNGYAIVTAFTMKTFKIGQIWGGVRTYSPDQHSALLKAVANYGANYSDPKSAIIPTFDFAAPGNLVTLALAFFFYDGPNPPEDVFADFDAIPSLTDSTKTQSYPDLLIANNALSLTGMHYQIRTNTFPQLPPKTQAEFYEFHYDYTQSHALNSSLQNIDFQVYSFAFQPIPASLITASQAAGGNVLGLDPANGDRVFVEYDVSWNNPLCDTACPQAVQTLANGIASHHRQNYAGRRPTHYKSGDVSFSNYNPLFMNDAMYDQDVFGGYGAANRRRLQHVARSVDPKGFFAKRQGGFKF